jgi:hypothetical protein
MDLFRLWTAAASGETGRPLAATKNKPMLDDNWTPSDKYTTPQYFHCPNTMCEGHVKLKNRSHRHFVRCEKCGLDFSIGAAFGVAAFANAIPARLNYLAVLLLGIGAGIILGRVVGW